MKRLGSSDSLGALISMCPTAEEHSPQNNHVYSREFQSMLDGLDEEGCIEENGQINEKKRRLSLDQVKALEKNFEVENKLEPERKVKLAQELGLQPRQVAVWFQNRRARWKTKQLERDYGLLKASYESLKLNYESLQHDNETLLKEIRELKSKLHEENTESNLSVKKEEIILASESDNKVNELQCKASITAVTGSDKTTDLNYESVNQNSNGARVSACTDMKDGSSDSDSSAILNEESSSVAFQPNNNNNNQLIMSPASSLRFNCSSDSSPSSMNCFQFADSRGVLNGSQKTYQPQFVKMEEHNFFSTEDSCNFFTDEQPPTLHWYCPDQWN